MDRVTPETHPDLEKSPFPCLVCGRVFCNVVSTRQAPNQPYEAATFNSHGHYGCTVFDSMNSARLEINVCDDCLTSAQAQGRVGFWPPHPKRRLVPWTDDCDEQGHVDFGANT